MTEPHAGRAATDQSASEPAATPGDPAGSTATSTPRPAERAAVDEIAELRAQLAEMEERWRRALADFDNLRKRVAREASQQRDDERARVAALWLPVLDNLELALQHADADPAAIVAGVRAVRDQALAVLAELGYPRRADENGQFDPSRHEAVAALPDTQHPPGTILQVIRPGYGSDERLLRPAAVVVAKGP
jgi:molecular chaperone GrpE